MTIDEYKTLVSNTITEVEFEDDEDIGFMAWDFFDNLGPYRDDTILVYSHTLDSTQTFLNEHCVGYQNIVCSIGYPDSRKRFMHFNSVTLR